MPSGAELYISCTVLATFELTNNKKKNIDFIYININLHCTAAKVGYYNSEGIVSKKIYNSEGIVLKY